MSTVTFSRIARGFSLVEILVSIIILGLGLLGLGALFPVVIRQQRISTDQTYGVVVGESARSIVVSNNAMIPAGRWSDFGTRPRMSVAAGYGLGVNFNWQTGNTTGEQFYERGEWYLASGSDPSVTRPLVLVDDYNVNRGLKRGAAWLGDPDDPANWLAIPLSQRLYPAGSETPQFVWDFAVQRISDGIPENSPESDGLRAVIFVRRIDQRIRVPEGATLRQVLLAEGPINAGAQRSPFGEDSEWQPTLDGSDGTGGYTYSQIRRSVVQFHHLAGDFPYQGRDRFFVPAGNADTDRAFALMRQPGQKLVDNLGNIYTVIGDGEDAANGRYVRISPAIPFMITEDQSENLAASPARIAIREVAFTAQVPVYVTTVEVAK